MPLQGDLSLLKSTVYVTNRYKEQLKENNNCPLCSRGFDAQNEVWNLTRLTSLTKQWIRPRRKQSNNGVRHLWGDSFLQGAYGWSTKPKKRVQIDLWSKVLFLRNFIPLLFFFKHTQSCFSNIIICKIHSFLLYVGRIFVSCLLMIMS